MIALNIGIDIGKRHDPTAIVVAVVEDRRKQGGWETHYTIPFLKRLELNTPYPEQARQLLDISKKATQRFWNEHGNAIKGQFCLYVDVTGGVSRGLHELRHTPAFLGPQS